MVMVWVAIVSQFLGLLYLKLQEKIQYLYSLFPPLSVLWGWGLSLDIFDDIYMISNCWLDGLRENCIIIILYCRLFMVFATSEDLSDELEELTKINIRNKLFDHYNALPLSAQHLQYYFLHFKNSH